MNLIRLLLSFLAVLVLAVYGYAQKPFYGEIQAFKAQDSARFPPKNAILFVGSSSFRMWDNMQGMFPGYTIINRGFGGSTLAQLADYMNDIVFPYKPKQIVIYSGENDIATDSVSAFTVFERFKTVYDMIRAKFPGVSIVYVSIKPSPSRVQHLNTVQTANRLIRSFLKNKSNARFVDVYAGMVDASGMPKQELFLEDDLHMNQQGYKIWQKAIQPHLLK
jgi:lysophospholipase L1-like esterase